MKDRANYVSDLIVIRSVLLYKIEYYNFETKNNIK